MADKTSTANNARAITFNGSGSFRNFVPLKRGELCSLKRHFKNCAREVVGYYSLLAANDPERFVVAGVPDITAHCNKGQRKGHQPYRQRQVEYVMRWLQSPELRVVSGIVERIRGMRCSGRIVTAHDALCARVPADANSVAYCAPRAFGNQAAPTARYGGSGN